MPALEDVTAAAEAAWMAAVAVAVVASLPLCAAFSSLSHQLPWPQSQHGVAMTACTHGLLIAKQSPILVTTVLPSAAVNPPSLPFPSPLSLSTTRASTMACPSTQVPACLDTLTRTRVQAGTLPLLVIRPPTTLVRAAAATRWPAGQVLSRYIEMVGVVLDGRREGGLYCDGSWASTVGVQPTAALANNSRRNRAT